MIPTREKLLLLVRELGPGGSERQVAELARGLDRERFDVTVGAFHARGPRADELRSAGVRVIEFPVRSLKNPSTLKLAWQLRGWLRREGMTIVHAFDYPGAVFGVPVARWSGVPLVLSSQRCERWLYPASVRRMLRWSDRWTDGIVINASLLARELTESYGIPRERIHLCYNGIDTSQFNALRRQRRPELAGAGLVIGTVAVLRPEKSLETLIAAFDRLDEPSPRLVIVGDGVLRGEIERRVAGLGSRCVMPGAQAETASWYRSFDLFVLPSKTEGLSNAILEAMACGGVPVVSEVGGNPELVREGENGRLFPAGDVEALTGILRRLAADPQERARMAESSQQRVAVEFTQAAMASRMSEIYLRLRSQRREERK